MLSLAKAKATERIAAEFYVNAFTGMRVASGVSYYHGLPEQEAHTIGHGGVPSVVMVPGLDRLSVRKSRPPGPLCRKRRIPGRQRSTKCSSATGSRVKSIDSIRETTISR